MRISGKERSGRWFTAYLEGTHRTQRPSPTLSTHAAGAAGNETGRGYARFENRQALHLGGPKVREQRRSGGEYWAGGDGALERLEKPLKLAPPGFASSSWKIS